MFKRFKKEKSQETSAMVQKNVLNIAIDLGMIKKDKDSYVITDLGYEAGCYRTRTGGIGFAGQSIVLLANS